MSIDLVHNPWTALLNPHHLLQFPELHLRHHGRLQLPLHFSGLEWKEKAENLELELQQCYKAHTRLSEQLVVEIAECRESKALVQEKEESINNLQNDISLAREENLQIKQDLDEKTKALDLLMSENQSLKAQLEEIRLKLKKTETENKDLIDRWMLEKMNSAEKLNEAYCIQLSSIEH